MTSVPGRHAAAEVVLRQAVRADPLNIRARAYFALGLGRQGRHVEAEAAYRDALRIADHPALHRGLGVSLYWQGRSEEAEAAFATAIHLEPDYVRAHCDLGEMFAEVGKHGALAVLKRHRGSPDSPPADGASLRSGRIRPRQPRQLRPLS